MKQIKAYYDQFRRNKEKPNLLPDWGQEAFEGEEQAPDVAIEMLAGAGKTGVAKIPAASACH